jgi:hypothetical protein
MPLPPLPPFFGTLPAYQKEEFLHFARIYAARRVEQMIPDILRLSDQLGMAAVQSVLDAQDLTFHGDVSARVAEARRALLTYLEQQR